MLIKFTSDNKNYILAVENKNRKAYNLYKKLGFIEYGKKDATKIMIK